MGQHARLRLGVVGMAMLVGPTPVASQSLSVPCAAPSATVRVDHVIITVRDLDLATATYGDLGFSFKDGRLHENRERNRHIKLASDEDLELMAVVGSAGDETAAGYLRFLEDGEGGAFLALSAPLAQVEKAADRLGVESVRMDGRAFSTLTFPATPSLAAVFFIEYTRRPEDPVSALDHANGAVDLISVRTEDDGALARLLAALGGRVCPRSDPDQPGVMAIRGSRLVLTPPGRPRARVLGVELSGAGVDGPRHVSAENAHGVSLDLAAGGRR